MSTSIRSVVVEIVASDVSESLTFYRLLGLIPRTPEGTHVEIDLPGGATLAFDTEEVIAGMHPGWTAPDGPGRVAIAFEFDTPADVDAVYGRLVAAGHPGSIAPFDAPWGQRYATVVDPGGTSVDLFSPLS